VVEKFNDKENIDLEQKGVKALVQQGLHKILQGKSAKSTGMSDEHWEKMDLKAESTIQLCLVDEVMYDVMNEEIVMSLWSRLRTLYITKSLSNKLYLKKQLYGLCMKEGTVASKHLNFFNKVINKRQDVDVKIDEENKALILLNLLLESYDHIITTILYGRKLSSWRISRQFSYLMRSAKGQIKLSRKDHFAGHKKQGKRRKEKFRLV